MALWSSSFQGLGSVEEDEERELTLTSIQRLSEMQVHLSPYCLSCRFLVLLSLHGSPYAPSSGGEGSSAARASSVGFHCWTEP